MMTHYERLGVSPTASSAELKAAWRRLASELHPDRHGGDKQKEAQFKAVAAAYDVLSDAEKRARYDLALATGSELGAEVAERAAEFGSGVIEIGARYVTRHVDARLADKGKVAGHARAVATAAVEEARQLGQHLLRDLLGKAKQR